MVQTPALLFSVCFESTNQIQNGFGVLGVDAAEKRKGSFYEKSFYAYCKGGSMVW